jgi:hypothetical protein
MPSPRAADMRTTSAPSCLASSAASILIPAPRASSIMLMARMVGTPTSMICEAR